MPKRPRANPLAVPFSDYQHPTIEVLEAQNLRYALLQDSPQTVILCLYGDHGNYTLSVVHVKEDNLILFHGIYPIKACELAYTETLRLLNYLNNALPGPAFRLDPDDGDIVFRHCVHLGTDAKLDPRPFNDALALCRVALDRDLPQIATVALGQCTFAATLAARRQTVSEN